MSKVGRKPISIPGAVKVQLSGQTVTVEGPKGKLVQEVHPRIKVEVQKSEIEVKRASDEKTDRALHGLTRSLIQNMINGVMTEYQKSLQIDGVGFKAQVNGQ